MYTSDNWDRIFMFGIGTVMPTATTLEATVVDKGDRPTDHYGEYMQGEDECWMIFKVTEPNGKERFFKKTGTQSSYGDERDWSWGTLSEVFPKTKTITVWE